MNLQEFMAANNGVWEDGVAVFADRGGYIIRVALGTPEKFEITSDGKRLGIQLVDTSADVVLSTEPKKRTRKAKVEEVPDLDDLDI